MQHKKFTDELTEYLSRQGFEARGLHGDMKQQQRTQVLSGFKAARTNILVATDVAARGIDVENIDFVINFDLPLDPEYYIHRIGRTGRAGKSGAAISLCCGRRQVWQLRELAKFAKSEILSQPLPTSSEVEAVIRQRLLDTLENQLTGAAASSCGALAQMLLEKGEAMGKTPRDIVSLLLENLSGGIPELPCIPEAVEERAPARPVRERSRGRERQRTRDTDMGYILLSAGKKDHVMPSNVVGAITQYAGISGTEVGRIDLYEDHTIVGVPLTKMAQILAQLQSFKICGQNATAEACGGALAPAKKRAGRYQQQERASRKGHFEHTARGEHIPRRRKTSGQSGKNRLN